jgi:N-dimethylarginine dimethylaminohydrolase
MSLSFSALATPPQVFASTPHFTRPTFLMCPPQWYGVDYAINPWMASNLHRSSRDLAFSQWKALYTALQSVADVRLLHPEAGSPDMTFLAHGAVVHHGVTALASFSHGQRQTETPHLRAWMEQHGFLIWHTPRETAFEGEGDVLFNDAGTQLWAGHGIRTCKSAHRHIADAWHVPVQSLHLVDPRFYHLDTCFAPLNGGHLLYYPEAFGATSRARIEAAFPAEKRIMVSEADAMQLACSALNVGNRIFTGKISDSLTANLEAHGFVVERLALGEFLKSGGGAKSLALRLSDLPVTHGRPQKA